ncbi:MAG TPA: hydrogenase formation protein HypD, partial [Pseudomonadales bacterium]|nr:hydrogenase formation protein HypD [Pseudomonadales bacterium]
MKYITEFRQPLLAQALAERIKTKLQDRTYRLMEFCGGHTHTIFRYGLADLMPVQLEFIHGPGCPVCVLPASRIEQAIKRLEISDAILCTYGDVLRVPAGGGKTLFRAKADGADVRMVYSPLDALKISLENPQRQVIFFALGFETTTPPTAVVIKQAARQGLQNFS